MMKLFEYSKTIDERSLIFLGINLYTYKRTYKKKFFLNGCIKIIKKFNRKHLIKIQYIKLYNKIIFKKIENGEIRLNLFLNIPIYKQKSINHYKNILTKKISKEHDDIYIFHGNSGEIYIFLTYFFNAFKKQNNSNKPFFITTKKYHNDIIKMIQPNIPFKYIKDVPLIKQNPFKIGNQRFFIIYNYNFYPNCTIKNKNNPDLPYFKLMYEELNIKDEDLVINKIIINPDEEQRMLKKVKSIGLNIQDFVFIAPEAKSNKLVNIQFWKNIIKNYKQIGKDVFLNLNDHKIKPFDENCKSIDLTFTEAFALAKRAKKIITLRSGFSEILMQTDVNLEVIHTNPNCFRTSQLSKHIPFYKTDKIHDYLITEDLSEEEIERIYEKIIS